MANLVPVNNNQLSKKINPNSFFGKKAKVGTTKIKSKGTTLRSEFVLIRKKVIKIDKLLNIFIKLEKKNQESNRRKGELSAREKSESKLEKTKKKETGLSFPSIPVGGNFLESIKRFLFFTFLNIALPKLLELLPKLRELGKAIAPVTNFLLNIVGGIGKGLLSGFVNFIDWGYKIRDNTEKTIKQIGGDKAAKDFNEFNKRLNTFIDLSILAGLTALDIGLDAQKYRKKQLEDQKKRGGVKPRVTEGRGGQKPIGRPKVTTGIGGKAGAGTVTQGRGGKPLGKFSKFKSGPFAKFAGPIGKFLGAATPFLGAGIGAADAAARFSSGDKVGGALASASAALDAFSGVAAITGFGLPLAGIATGISIGIDIVLLVRDLIKVMLPGVPMFRNGGRIKLFAQGGRVGSSGRTIKAQRKTFGAKSFKQEVKPGKDIGGKQQILKLFPDPSSENRQQTIAASPWWERWLGGKNQTTQTSGKPANPYKALKTTAEILGKIPGPFGKLMSAGASIPLGQKPDRDIGRGFGSFIGQITQDIIDNNVNISFGNIMKSISGFAGGGDIRDQNIMKNNDIGYQVGQVVEKAIGSLISSKVNEAVTSIQKEIASIGKPPEQYLTGPPVGDGTSVQSIDMSGLSQEDVDALGRMISAESGGESDAGKASVMNVILNRYRLARSGKGYLPSGKNKDNVTIRDILFAPNQFSPIKDKSFERTSSDSGKSALAQAIASGGNDPQKLKAKLISLGLSEQDANYVIVSTTFSNPQSRSSRPFNTKEVTVGNHVFQESPFARLSAPGQKIDANVKILDQAMVTGGLKPSEIALTSGQGWRWGKMHKGIDLDGGDGSPISSAQDAKVIWAGDKGDGYGYSVVLKYSNGAETRFAHLKSMNVRAGGSVKAGQLIGKQGNTGSSTASHLHFEYYPRGGAMSYEGYGDAFSVKDNYFRYGGNVKPKLAPKPLDNTQLSQQPTGKILRSFKAGNFTYTEREGGKYTENGKPITKQLYDAVLRNQRTDASQQQASLAPTQKKQSVDSLAFTPSYAEGQSGFLAIQPIRETLIQQA